MRTDQDPAAFSSALPQDEREARSALTVKQIADKKLLEQFGPPSVLVNESFEVLQFRGDIGPYFSPAPGSATLQVLKLLRAELHVEVWRALQQALHDNAPIRNAGVRLGAGINGERNSHVAFSVIPVTESEPKIRCFLIIFEERRLAEKTAASNVEPASREEELQQELTSTREYLQTSIEELETTNEELKSTNEELQSSNEELQSTNEELETSKEELQSVNEELMTLNNELQHRMGQLSRSNDDVRSLMANMDQPVCFVDERLVLRLVSTAAQRTLGFTEADVGRSLSQLRPFFGGIDVERAVKKSTERLVRAVEQFRSSEGRWFELRALPYQATSSTGMGGSLIVMRDIHSEKKDADLAIDVAAYADNLLRAIPHPLVILDEQQRVVWVNASFLGTFNATTHDTLGNLFHRLGSGEWADPQLRAFVERALKTGAPFNDFRLDHNFGEPIGTRSIRVSGIIVEATAEKERLLLLSIEDLTSNGKPPSHYQEAP